MNSSPIGDELFKNTAKKNRLDLPRRLYLFTDFLGSSERQRWHLFGQKHIPICWYFYKEQLRTT